MPFEFILNSVEAEAELANVEALDVMVEGRVWTVVPGAAPKLTQFNPIDCFDFREFEMGHECSSIHSFVLAVFRVVLITCCLLDLLNLQLFIIDALVSLKLRRMGTFRILEKLIHSSIRRLMPS